MCVLCPARSGFAFGTESVAAAATVAENVRESQATVDGSLSSTRRPRTLILPPPADRSRRHGCFRGLDGIRKGKCPYHQHVCRVEEGYRCRRARLSLSLTSKTLAAADRCSYGRKNIHREIDFVYRFIRKTIRKRSNRCPSRRFPPFIIIMRWFADDKVKLYCWFADLSASS